MRLALASGRDLPELVAALTRSGALEPLPPNPKPAERRELLAEVARSGDRERGRAIYARSKCATCHQLGTKGGLVGPELTSIGAFMTPESILESLLNPSTTIKQGFETVIAVRKNGTTVAGILQRRSDTATLVRDASNRVVAIPNQDILDVTTSTVSLMPKGLTATMRRSEVIDLLRFLMVLGKPGSER